jgi:hypothetical protein
MRNFNTFLIPVGLFQHGIFVFAQWVLGYPVQGDWHTYEHEPERRYNNFLRNSLIFQRREKEKRSLRRDALRNLCNLLPLSTGLLRSG